jgi:hypothetical protein
MYSDEGRMFIYKTFVSTDLYVFLGRKQEHLEELHEYIQTVVVQTKEGHVKGNRKVHPRTGHEGPEGE